ncbi:unnamed protein product [Parascedosporium putredinis]|uniref:RecQ mediated genome instability protein 1 OB-fold domain-containing protein n=1 Tax=Parascedosporium putredinis TaxID=1442378 RepID=A0A9P1H2C1_9PEZI|nr:unnamed protein product [Parascedosporium putredinis]CAI7994803.1 unnamed protein product [Parascedosporium putredinis]
MSLAAQLTTSLQQSSFPLPSPTLITTLLSSHPQPTLPRLLAQAKSHVLTSNLTTPSLLDHSVPIFPAPLLGPDSPDARLPFDVPAQIVDVEDLSRSRWEQVEEMERIERGEMTKGRAVVRVEEREDGDGDGGGGGGGGGASGSLASSANAVSSAAAATRAARRTNATHRIVLQDRSGRRVYGLELVRMDRLGVGVTRIGKRGYVETEEKKWLAERLKILREAIGATERR